MPSLNGQHVLIVEDEPLLAFDYADELQERGACPDVATTLSEAMAALAKHLPNLAIVDVNLGDETSWPVAAELTRFNVPFFLVSGYRMKGRIPDGICPVDCIEKPVGAYKIANLLTAL